MTTSADDTPEMVEVTQADRLAAAAFLKANERYWIDRVSAIYSGKGDDDPVVQSHARHRLASTKALREALEPFAKAAPQIERMPAGALIWHANLDGDVVAISRENVLRIGELASGDTQ